MGNKSPKQFERKSGYPFQVNLMQINMKVDLDNVRFQQSSYNIMEQKHKIKPMMDKNIRNSQFCKVDCPALSLMSRRAIRKYLVKHQVNYEHEQVSTQWRMTRYNEGGHFLEHCDREKELEGFIHFGTEIFLPPNNQVQYEGGQLVVTYNGNKAGLIAFPDMWTHIILPLGISHQVNKVTNKVVNLPEKLFFQKLNIVIEMYFCLFL